MDPENPSGEIPTTVHSTDALLEQAEVLAQRVADNPDFKVMLDITHRVQRATMFNTVYSVILTIIIMLLSIVAYNTWHNGNVVEGLVNLCEQDNQDKKADLASWKFIVSLIPPSDQATAILVQREDIDKPVDC